MDRPFSTAKPRSARRSRRSPTWSKSFSFSRTRAFSPTRHPSQLLQPKHFTNPLRILRDSRHRLPACDATRLTLNCRPAFDLARSTSPTTCYRALLYHLKFLNIPHLASQKRRPSGRPLQQCFLPYRDAPLLRLPILSDPTKDRHLDPSHSLASDCSLTLPTASQASAIGLVLGPDGRDGPCRQSKV